MEKNARSLSPLIEKKTLSPLFTSFFLLVYLFNTMVSPRATTLVQPVNRGTAAGE